jgi:hypothetical protein
VNIGFHTGLNAQTSAVNSSEKSYIQTLFDRFEEKHHQMMSDVEAAKRQCVFISGPIALHQFWLESFLLEEAFLVSGINWGFARNTNVTDADFV